MNRTLLEILLELEFSVDLSTIEDTRALFISNMPVTFGGRLFDGFGLDVAGSVFYKCALGASEIDNAVLIACDGSHLKVPEAFGVLCTRKNISLRYVDFQSGNLEEAYLRFCDLEGANLNRAYLMSTKLDHASLFNSNLQNAYLDGASLIGANIQYADLRAANLTDASLESALLMYAQLDNTNFRGADLRNANLSGATMSDSTNFEDASYNAFTKGLLESQKNVMYFIE